MQNAVRQMFGGGQPQAAQPSEPLLQPQPQQPAPTMPTGQPPQQPIQPMGTSGGM